MNGHHCQSLANLATSVDSPQLNSQFCSTVEDKWERKNEIEQESKDSVWLFKKSPLSLEYSVSGVPAQESN